MPRRVPEPAKGGCHKGGNVSCSRCGTNTFYSLEDMLNHQAWCGAAKKKSDDEKARKKARSNSVKHRR